MVHEGHSMKYAIDGGSLMSVLISLATAYTGAGHHNKSELALRDALQVSQIINRQSHGPLQHACDGRLHLVQCNMHQAYVPGCIRTLHLAWQHQIHVGLQAASHVALTVVFMGCYCSVKLQ